MRLGCLKVIHALYLHLGRFQEFLKPSHAHELSVSNKEFLILVHFIPLSDLSKYLFLQAIHSQLLIHVLIFAFRVLFDGFLDHFLPLKYLSHLFDK
jgi:hypothetical protein